MKKHLYKFFIINMLCGMLVTLLVLSSAAATPGARWLNGLLTFLMAGLTAVWGSFVFRSQRIDRYLDNLIRSLSAFLSRPKTAPKIWAGLILLLILIPLLYIFPIQVTVINLLKKRLLYPLIWLFLITIQTIYLINLMQPLKKMLQNEPLRGILLKMAAPVQAAIRNKILSKHISMAALLLMILYIINLFIVSLPDPRFSADSYKYWQLSETIGVDFYRINYVVQYIFGQPYSVDAPPLYPVLIWLVNHIYDLKIYGGYLINFLIALAIFTLLQRIGRILFHNPVFSCVISVVLFSFVHFQRELSGARVIPLATLLQLSIVYIVLKHDQLKTRHIVLIGLLAGLNIMTRFDFLLASLVLGLVLAAIDRQDRLKRSFIYYGLLALCYSPWVIYSYTHFGVLMASKDARTVNSVVLTHSNHYFPAGKEPLTVLQAPLQWLPTMLLRVRLVAIDLVETLTVSPFTALLLAAVLVMFAAGLLKSILCFSLDKKPVFLDDITIKLNKLGLVFAALWFTTALSGYAVERYYTPAFLYLSIWLMTMINRAFKEVLPPGRLGSVFVSALLLLPLGIAWYSTPKAYDMGYTPPELAEEMRSQMSLEAEFDILQGLPAEPVIFVTDGYNCAKFGVLSGYRTYCMPFNLDDDNIDDYFQQYDDITHLLIPTTPTYRFLAQHLRLERIDESLPLYELAGLR